MARLTGQNIAMELTVRVTDAAANFGLSFENLVAAQEPRVRRLAHRLLGWRDAADVDDVVQDVFLAALKKIESFRGDANIATWLTRVTINRCRTHRRRQLVKLTWLRRQKTPATAPAADAKSLTDDTNAQVRAAVQSLSPKEREVVVLFYLEDLPVAEVAALLGITRSAADVRLHRARKSLKKRLAGLLDESL